MVRQLEPALRDGLAQLGLSLQDGQIDSLLSYLELIQKWNKVYNLTAVRDMADMLTHHLLDSLSVVRAVQAHDADAPLRLLDVGSGAGLPGVVIAICCPEIQVDCVDAVAKKAAFIQQVAAALQLPNLRGLHSRVEQLPGRYDLIVSRAFSSLANFVSLSGELLADKGSWLAMKGKSPTEEVAALPAEIQVFHVEQLQVPGLDAERCLVWMKRLRA